MSKVSEAGRVYGWTPDHPDQRDVLYSCALSKLPKKVDLRGFCSPVEDQKSLGSCTAQAIVGACEFVEDKNGKKLIDLSRLFLYYNERAMEGTVNSDSGASIRDGIKSLIKQGVCSEAKWPYDVTKFKKKPTADCYKEAKTHQATAYARLLGLTALKKCLASGYPFVFGFSVYESFEGSTVAKTGIVNLPKSGEKCLGGHAVLAVGYDDASQRVIVRNSWGPKWGQQGYFTMPYDYVSSSRLASDFWSIRGVEGF